MVSHAGTCKGTYIRAHNPPFHSVWRYDLATSQQWKLPCVTTKKELPSSLINFLYWADLDTHTYDVCLYSCQWYEGKTGSAATDVLLDLCVYLSFVLLSPASPLKFDWCPVIYSFHLVCLLSLSLSVCVCVSYYIGRRPIVIIADPDMLRHVMVKEFNKFPNRMVSEWHYIYSLISKTHTQQFITSCIIKPEAYMHSKNDFNEFLISSFWLTFQSITP